MAKVRMKANKLENPTVNFISLVQRGANRIPFRIIKLDKQESEMSLDLGQMFRRKVAKNDAPQDDANSGPVLAGIVIQAGEDVAAFETVLKEHGFSAEGKVENEDGTIVYKQGDVKDEESLTILRVSDDVLALVAKFDKSLITKAAESFFEENGFVPQYSPMEDVFKTVLPESVMKMADGMADMKDKAKAKAKKPAAKPADEEVDPEDPELTEEEKAAAAKAAAAKEKQKPVPAKKDEGAAAAASSDETPLTAEAVTEIVKKAVEASVTALSQAFEKTIGGLAEQVSGIAEQGQTLATKMAEVEKVAKAADESVRGTVIGGHPSGDKGTPITTKKADGDPRTGVFDTAFLPRQTSVSKFQRR